MSYGRRLPLSLLVASLWAAPVAAQTAPPASPLAAYPGFGHRPEEDEARFAREEMEREQRIAACMQAAGFTYTPAPAVRVDPSASTPQEAAAPEDPNQAFAASLTPDQRRAYNLALYGIADPNAEDAEVQDTANTPNGGGCSGAALRAVPGVYAARSALADEYVAMRRSIQTNRRALAAERSWSSCMAVRRVPYATTSQLAEDLERLSVGMVEPNRPKVLATVAADEACSQASSLDDVVADVTVDKEADFVARHRALLEEHRRRLQAAPTP